MLDANKSEKKTRSKNIYYFLRIVYFSGETQANNSPGRAQFILSTKKAEKLLHQ